MMPQNRRTLLVSVAGAFFWFAPCQVEADTDDNFSLNAVQATKASATAPRQSSDRLLFTGAFTHSVPLEIPPGIADMQPDLSITYNSQGGSSWISQGWELSLGSIQRATKSGPPTYTASDAFVASRGASSTELVLTSTPNVYRSKIEDSFQRFEKFSSSWTVLDKRGNRYLYGVTSAGRLNKDSNTFLWALERVEDRNGNAYDITYTQDQGQIYPARIDYGSNLSTGRVPDRRISFTFETNPSSSTSYRPSFKQVTAKRLQKIETFVVQSTWTVVKRYQFSYATPFGRVKPALASVQVIGVDGATALALPPTKFGTPSSPVNWAEQSTSSPLQLPVTLQYFETSVGVRFGDVNGDGRVDAVRSDASERKTWINSGTSWDESAIWTPPSGYEFSWSGQEQGTRLVDLNGDGKADLVRSYKYDDSPTISVLINNGAGWGSPPPGTDWDLDIDGYQVHLMVGDDGDYAYKRGNGVQFVDMNGDGRVDIVENYIFLPNPTYNSNRCWLNTGTGWEESSGYRLPADEWSTVISDNGRYTYPYGMSLVDINGDGLTDVVVSLLDDKYGKDHVRTYLNKGPGWEDVTSNWPAPDRLFLHISGVLFEGGVQWADVNGDGLVDWVQSEMNDVSPASDKKKVHLNTGSSFVDVSSEWSIPIYFGYDPNRNCLEPPCRDDFVGGFFLDVNGDGQQDLVQHLVNGLGTGKFVGLSQAKPELLIQIGEVFGGTTTVTYAASTLPTQNQTIPFPMQLMTKAETDDGRGTLSARTFSYFGGLFDPVLRESLGFSRAEMVDAAASKEVTWFHQKNDSSGNPVPFNGLKGRPYKVELTDQNGMAMSRQETHWTWFTTAPAAGYVVALSTSTRVTEFRANGTADRVTGTDIAYNLVSTSPAFGNVVQTKALGDVSMAGDDVTTDITYAANVSTYPLMSAFPGTTVTKNSTGTKIAEFRFFYDGSTTPASVSLGNVTRTETSLFIATSPSSPIPRWIATVSSYNAYGQVIWTADARGSTTTYAYDDLGFSSSVVNALGHAVYTTVDPRTGQVLYSTDTNNQLTRFVYDPLCRIIKEIGPLDSDTFPAVVYNYHNELIGQPAAQYVEENVREKYGQSGTIWSKTYMDGQGRAYRTEQEDVSPKNVISETVFDNRGYAIKLSVPRFNTAASTQWTESTYDAAGRVVEVKTPDDGETLTIYDGRSTLVYDPNGNIQESVTDGFGRVIQRREPGITNATTYYYDAAGNLTSVVDSQGKQSTFAYDSLGRKIAMYDVNAGSWTYTYDDSGNLIRQTDARGVEIEITYDALNRVTAKTLAADPSGATGQSTGTVLGAFAYDDPNRPYSKGRLTAVSAGASSGTATGYLDNFTQASAVNPASHTMDEGPGWAGANASNGSFKVGLVANKLTCTLTTTTVSMWVDGTPPTADYSVILRGRVGSGATSSSKISLSTRWDTTSDTKYYAIMYGALDGAGRNFYVTYELNGSDEYHLFSGSTTINKTTEYTWELKAEGNVISLLKDGVTIGSATDSAISWAGKPGVGLRRTEPQVDYFEVVWSSTAATADATAFFYDKVGRTVEKIRTVDSATYTFRSAYDARDRLTSLTYPSGRIITYDYDAAGRLSTVKGASGTIIYASYPSYTALDKPLEFEQAGGDLATAYTYDPLKHTLATLQTTSNAAGIIQNFSYTVDRVGNIRSINDLLHPSRKQSFEYDGLNRLTFADGLYGSQAYSYDALGNLQTKGPIGLSYVYASSQPYAVRASSPTADIGIDGDTLVAWHFDPSDPIHTISGTAQNTGGSATGNVPVTLSGPANLTLLSSTASPVGKFEFRGLPGGASYSVAFASSNMTSTPLGLTFNPLSANSTGNTLRLLTSTQPAINSSTLRIPRMRFEGGKPSGPSEQSGKDAGFLGAAGFGGWISSDTATGTVNISGYAPLGDPADVAGGQYLDYFTQASAVNPAAHAMDEGPGWTGTDANSGNLKVGAVANRLTSTTSNWAEMWADGTPPSADYAIIAAGRTGAASTSARFSLGLRWDTAADTKYTASIRGAVDGSNKNFYVSYEQNNVTQYDLFSGSTTIDSTTDYTWELKAQGNVISLLKDGVVVGSATDSAITTAGQAGVAIRGTQPQMDSFHVVWGSTSAPPYNPTYGAPGPSGFGIVGPAFTTGNAGQALAFNGASDVFVFPESADLAPSTFSLMAVIKATQAPSSGYATILAKSTNAALGGITSGARLLLQTDGRARFEVGRSTSATSVVSPEALSLNRWNFLAATYDGAAARLYVNGVEVASVTAGGAIPNGHWLTAGASLTDQFSIAPGSEFLGSIDEPRFQGRPWTAGEITALQSVYGNTATYAYDAAGNMISRLSEGTTTSYRYNAYGRLSEVKVGTAVVAAYQYDADGKRAKMTTPKGTTLYVDNLMERRPDASEVDHIFADDSPITDIVTSGTTTVTTHLVADHLGSVTHVTDDDGAVLQQLAYAPFGETAFSAGASSNKRTYTAQREDTADRRDYGARFYFPAIGRFYSPDSIVPSATNPQSLNRYSYVENNPILRNDPSGNSYWVPWVVGGAMAYGFLSGGTQGNILSLNAYRTFDMRSGLAGAAEWGTGTAMFAAAGPASSVLRNSAIGGFSAAGSYMAGTIASGETFSAAGFAESFAWGAGLTGLVSKLGASMNAFSQARGKLSLWSGSTRESIGINGRSAVGVSESGAAGAATKSAGLEIRGLRPLPGTRQIPEGIPDNWRIRSTKAEGGTWYYDPANKGNAVRVMQGDPASPFQNSQSPYVRWQRNGQALDINGNVVPKNSPNAHIPLRDFRFDTDLFK